MKRFWKIFFSTLTILIIGNCSEKPESKVHIFAPATPASLPVVMAALQMPNTKVTVFKNHPKAHALFNKGDIDLLVTGLSVGLNFHQQGKDIKIINSYVSGLTYLITRKRNVKSFKDLKGETLIIPFENSPIDELTRFFVEQEGLSYGKDIKIQYALPYAARTLMASGKASHAPLPEPLVSALLLAKTDLHRGISYRDYYLKTTGKIKGYPQVGTFVKTEIANKKLTYLSDFNRKLKAAIETCKKNPDKAIELAADHFEFSPMIMKKALQKTVFEYYSGQNLKQEIYEYYRTIKKPLEEKTNTFFSTIE